MAHGIGQPHPPDREGIDLREVPVPTEPTREQQAKAEIGRTAISPRAAKVLCFLFLAIVFVVPVAQAIQELREYAAGQRPSPLPQAVDIVSAIPEAGRTLVQHEGGLLSRTVAANRALLRDMRAFEDELEDVSILAKSVRPWMQYALTAGLGAGNEQAYPGREGWVFFRPEIDLLTGAPFLDERQLQRRRLGVDEWQTPPQPDPRIAILDFHRQLAGRGITLVLVPAPAKASIHPEMFYPGAGLPQRTEPLLNPSHRPFVESLRARGIIVLDPADALMDEKLRSGRAQYLAADTHWTPEAMDLVARQLADVVRDHVATNDIDGAAHVTERPVEVAGPGDTSAMLDLPPALAERLFPPQPVLTRQVLAADGSAWRPSADAPVLLLGDSFTNIFSLAGMGWGEGAGLAERLAFHLRQPVDVIARNDAGAHATRQMLAAELARGNDRLAGKRVVIWQFAARELAIGDWMLIDMHLRERTAPRTIEPAGPTDPPGGIIVTATVAARSSVPQPGTVPYADQVMALHLVDIDGPPGVEADVVAYTLGMKDRAWTDAARLRVGQRITVRLRDWSEVAAEMDRLSRSELDDIELQLRDYHWGELLRP